MNRSNLGHRLEHDFYHDFEQEAQKHIRCNGSSTVGVEVVAHVVEEEVAEVREEVFIGEVVAASSRESALPRFQQCPPNGAQEGVAVGDVAAAEWSAGVAHEVVDGVLTSTP